MKFPNISNGGGNGSGQGGVFLKLKDGDKLKGVFRGDPHIFKQHWIGGRSQFCPGKDECGHCKSGDKAKFRFHINFLTKVDGIWIAKIFDNSYGTFKDLKEMHEDAYDLEQTCVILSRSGEGTDTRYRIMPAKDNGGLNAAEFKKLASVPLNALFDEAEVEETGEEIALTEEVPF